VKRNVVRHTRGFTPGWYAVPRWGTPNASPPRSLPAPLRSGSGTGPERALERRHPDPPRAPARKLRWPQRSLRAQDWSRGAPSMNFASPAVPGPSPAPGN